MSNPKRIGFIGAGKLGQALISGLQRGMSDVPIWAAVRTEESKKDVHDAFGIPTTTEVGSYLRGTDVLILAVKPRVIKTVCDAIQSTGTLPETTLIISVAAGVTIREIETALGGKNPVIRAMPNTPCRIHRGMTVLCRGASVTEDQLELSREVFRSIGECVDLTENLMDAATAVSASGPAFLFLIIEALIDGAVKVGLPRDKAKELVVQCVVGSAEMVRTTDRHPASLRDEVTTPGGCTIGGVLVLEDGKIRSVLARAVEEATRIAGGLGK